MRTIVVGDVQGCLDELKDLMEVVEYRQGQDRLILAGDLLDRGPDSAGVVQWAMDNGAEAVMGNHEESHLRFRMHELRKQENPSYKNPMRERPPGSPHRVVYDSITDEQWVWLATLPSYLLIGDNWAVVHAGCMPGVPVEQQETRHLQRLRYVNRATVKMASLDDPMKPETHCFWTDLWTGPRSVVYGHHVEATGAVSTVGELKGRPAVMKDGDCLTFADGAYGTLGIDTGCCFGHALTCAIFVGDRVVQIRSVPARKTYDSNPRGPDLA